MFIPDRGAVGEQVPFGLFSRILAPYAVVPELWYSPHLPRKGNTLCLHVGLIMRMATGSTV